MVSAEAAACGSPPLVARHSGLADVAAALEAEYPPEHRELVSFASGEAEDLAAKLEVILGLPRTEWEELSKGARRAVTRRFGWERIGALILSGPWEKPSA
jgi:glycosyltransferase involved in cell wall biosynthesis